MHLIRVTTAAGLFGAAALALAAAAQAQSAPSPSPERIAEGKMLFESACGGCHELSRANDRPRTRQEWNAVMDLMVNYGLSSTREEIAKMTDYLVAVSGT